MSASKESSSVRERLLAAANELFYEEGVHTVGIDRVIARAGVAKASLYSAFGSKDALVEAYLEARSEARRERIERRVASFSDPRACILAVFDLLGETAAKPGFRGCAFVNASAEGPRDTEVVRICNDSRQWLCDLFARFARDLGAAEPESLGRQLALLYDGAIVGASMTRDTVAAEDAKQMAIVLLEAAASAGAARDGRARANKTPKSSSR